MAFDSGIKVFFGGDTSQLRASLNEANGLVDSFTKSVKRAGIDLGRGFGFGVLIFQAKQFFDAVINDAQKTRDAFEEMGKPVPSSVASVARLADEIDRAKKGALSLGTTILSWATKAGEGWGMLINRVRGVSREQEQLYEQIEKDADKQEKARDEAAKNADAKEKSRREQAKRDAERDKREAAAAEDKRLEAQYDSLTKVGEAEQKLDEHRKKSAYERLDLQGKINADEKESVELARKIAEYKQHATLSDNDKLKVIELENQLLDNGTRLYENRKELAEKTKLTEEQIAKALEKQKNSLASIVGIRGGNQFNDASDESLAEVARRNRNKAQAIRGGQGGFGIGQDLEAARLEAEAMNAERELGFRARIRQDTALGGKDAARANFAGDPLLFDRVFDQIVKGQSTSEKAAQTLEDIKDALTRRGIVTVPAGR